MGTFGRVDPPSETPAQSGGRYLAHGHLGADVMLSWHLPLLPEPFPSFVQNGARTANPLLLSPMREGRRDGRMDGRMDICAPVTTHWLLSKPRHLPDKAQATSASPSIFGRSVSSEKSRTAASGQRGVKSHAPTMLGSYKRNAGQITSSKADHQSELSLLVLSRWKQRASSPCHSNADFLLHVRTKKKRNYPEEIVSIRSTAAAIC